MRLSAQCPLGSGGTVTRRLATFDSGGHLRHSVAVPERSSLAARFLALGCWRSERSMVWDGALNGCCAFDLSGLLRRLFRDADPLSILCGGQAARRGHGSMCDPNNSSGPAMGDPVWNPSVLFGDAIDFVSSIGAGFSDGVESALRLEMAGGT